MALGYDPYNPPLRRTPRQGILPPRMEDSLNEIRGITATMQGQMGGPSYASRLMGSSARQSTATAPRPAMRSQGLMAAPITAQDYQQAMNAQNAGGRFYGGLLPAQVTSPSGQVRPGFLAAPAQAGGTPEGIRNAEAGLLAKGYYRGKTGAWSPNQQIVDAAPSQVRAAQAAGVSPFATGGLTPAQAAAGRPAYEQGLLARQDAQRQQTLNRVGIRQQAAQQRQQQQMAMLQAQQENQMFGLLMRTNPALAVQMQQGNMRNQLAQGQLGLQQQQLAQQGLLGMQQSQDRRYVADQGVVASQNRAWGERYSQAIKDGNTPDDAMRIAGPPPSAAPSQGGLLGTPPQGRTAKGGYKPKKQLLDSQLAAVAQAPPEQRAGVLRSFGVTNATDLYYYQNQLDPSHGQGVDDYSLGNALRQGNWLGPAITKAAVYATTPALWRRPVGPPGTTPHWGDLGY